MTTTEEAKKLIDELRDQVALANTRLNELVRIGLLDTKQAEKYRMRLGELGGAVLLGKPDDVHLKHIAQQFLLVACEILLGMELSGYFEDDLSNEDAFLRLEVIRLAGEQAALGAELRRIQREYDNFRTPVSRNEALEHIRLLEARLHEINSGLEAIHRIRVRLGLSS